ncbi:uncharacterized protein LOC133201452 [Saccostrea echinata]|uniref:uncharacterized protein LOC133201452 n=1 Tax=Saccostrea echinata TaxID=191078 RepID=UPI002A80428B|nr:uncharacterized protein LOC133201452 [Saccostrea echinata]
MDPWFGAQDILRCDLCRTDFVQSRCEVCQIKLCKACVGEHLSDSTKNHRVVPYKAKGPDPNYPECPNHAPKLCELYCEECDTPVCSTCISSGKHQGHKISDVLQNLMINSETKQLEKNLRELDEKICPQYEEIFSELNCEIANIAAHYEKLTSTITAHGEDWLREIETIMKKLKSEIDDMKKKHLSVLTKQEEDITKKISEVKKSIAEMKKILENKDRSLISSYQSRNAEFRRFPPKLKALLPSFSAQPVHKDIDCQQFGSLTKLSMETVEHSFIMDTQEAASSQLVKSPLNLPELVITLDVLDRLRGVLCLNDEEIWTCGQTKFLKLHNVPQGEKVKSIKTKSEEWPNDIALTKDRDLVPFTVYIDSDKRTVNVVKNKEIQEVITLQEWKPNNVCSTSSGDILVTMDKAETKQSKIVRYSGYVEVQKIQYDDKGKSLFSSYYLKHICENRNLDICVADHLARTLVVVSHAGKLRFRYTGHPSIASGALTPYGITTDSQGQILTSDCDRSYIHILDKDGLFLRYINNCNLQSPWGLCVDSRDYLFVAELKSDGFTPKPDSKSAKTGRVVNGGHVDKGTFMNTPPPSHSNTAQPAWVDQLMIRITKTLTPRSPKSIK